jgi:hypothetical protein
LPFWRGTTVTTSSATQLPALSRSTKGDAARRVEIGPRLARVLADHQARERDQRVSPLVSLAAMG